MPDVWTLLIAIGYPVGLVATFIWGLIRFRISDGWDRVGDRLWFALLACGTAMAWYFLIDVIRLARGRA